MKPKEAEHEDLLDDAILDEAERDMETADAGEVDSQREDSTGPPPLRPFPPTDGQMADAAAALLSFREQAKIEKQYVSLPEWQYLGAYFGLTVSTELLREKIGDMIVARAKVMRCGQIITQADSTWRPGDKINGRPIYGNAVLATAQSMAASRALANLFRPVAVLAGLSQTPAEEMETVAEEPETKDGIVEADKEAEKRDLARGPGAPPKGGGKDDLWADLCYLMEKAGDDDKTWRRVTFYEKTGKSMTKKEAEKSLDFFRSKDWDNGPRLKAWIVRARKLLEE